MTGFVPFDKAGDNARLLLAVADMLGIDQQKVATSSEGFVVPDEILAEYQKALAAKVVDKKLPATSGRRTRR
jgi:hypothetical protein